MIYIVIPVLNRWHYTEKCLLSLRAQVYTDFKVVVVDHGSIDGTREKIQSFFPEVVLLFGNDSMWWTDATNLGIDYAIKMGAKYVLTLNNDLEVDCRHILNARRLSEGLPNAIIGSVVVNIDNPTEIEYAGKKWNKITAKYKHLCRLYTFENIPEIIESDILPGRGTLIPVNIFIQIGLFDAAYFPHYAADEDFSLRAAKAGYRLVVSGKSLIYSHSNKNLTKFQGFQMFTSKRSPLCFRYRWRWARKHTPFPLVYIFFDYLRVLKSLEY